MSTDIAITSHDGGSDHDAHAHPPLSFRRKYIFSTDHKVIGIQFLFTSLFFFILGGLLALLIRTQLAWPWEEIPVISQLLYADGGGVLLQSGDRHRCFQRVNDVGVAGEPGLAFVGALGELEAFLDHAHLFGRQILADLLEQGGDVRTLDRGDR